MESSRIVVALAALGLAFSSGGCYQADRLERMGYEILDACPDVRFKKDISLSLGGVSWGILKSIALSVEKDDPEVRTYIRNLSKIELVVYKTRGISRDDARPIGEIIKRQLDDSWDLMVKSVEDGDLTWVHYRQDGDRIREMQITAYDSSDEEFVIVHLSGRLDRIMEVAIEDAGGFTDKIVRHSRE